MPTASSGSPAMSSAPRTWRASSTSTRPSRATAAAARTGCSIVQLNSDEERFFATHSTATAPERAPVLRHRRGQPDLDRQRDPRARENARTLRPLISTEMWVQLNVFYNRLLALEPRTTAPGRLAALFGDDQGGLPDPYRHHRRHLLSATRAGISTSSAATSSAPTRPRGCSTSSIICCCRTPPMSARRPSQPVERAAALGRRLPRLSPPPPGEHRPRRGSPAFCCSIRPSRARSILRARGRAGCSASSSRAMRCATATMPPRSSTACGRCSGPLDIDDNICSEGLHEFLDLMQQQLIAVTRELSTALLRLYAAKRRRRRPIRVSQ